MIFYNNFILLNQYADIPPYNKILDPEVEV